MSIQKLADIKAKSPTELLALAEDLEVENASSMRKQDMLFAILKEFADREEEIIGTGVLEVLQDGFGFLRSPEANYLQRLRKGSAGCGDDVVLSSAGAVAGGVLGGQQPPFRAVFPHCQ